MVVRVCIDANHLPFVTSLAFPQGIAPGENIELYIGTWDLPENPPPKANTIVVDPLTKVVHVARTLESGNKRKHENVLEGARKKANNAANMSGPSSNGSGKHKCGECGERFDTIKEISLHMQQHLTDKLPQNKNSVVTLTYRTKDGSPHLKATITHDPSRRNVVEISIPATAAESFLKAAMDQAQQVLRKHVRPTGSNIIEFTRSEEFNEGDTNKKITVEAVEKAADEPVANAPTPPLDESSAEESLHERIDAVERALDDAIQGHSSPSSAEEPEIDEQGPSGARLPPAEEMNCAEVRPPEEIIEAQEPVAPSPPQIRQPDVEPIQDAQPVFQELPPPADSPPHEAVARVVEPEVPVVEEQPRFHESQSAASRLIRADREVQEIGSSSEAVPASPHFDSRHSHFDQPTSSADVDSTVGDHIPDDGGVDSTSHNRRHNSAEASSAFNRPTVDNGQDRNQEGIVINEAAARQPVSQSGQFERRRGNNGMMNMIIYGVPDDIQEPHSGMQ